MRWYWLRYKVAQIPYWWHNGLPWTIAMWLPRKVALFAFVRVFAIRGDCPPVYSETYQMWEERTCQLRAGNRGAPPVS